jgi:NADH:ubiquinone oxidoreductase subunit 6 (subunit J)
MLISDNAVHSALFLIANFGCVAFMYLMLDAPFIAMVQIAVYAGAIMVLFLFVIMLLGAEQSHDTTTVTFRWLTGAATILGASLLFALGLPLVIGGFQLPETAGRAPLLRVVNAGVSLVRTQEIAPAEPAAAATADPAATAEAPAAAPAEVVRFSGEVQVTLTGGSLSEPLVLNNVPFGEATDFFDVPAGDYTVQLLRQEDGQIMAAPYPLTLAADSVTTLTLFGEYDFEARKLLKLVPVANSLAQVGNDEGRFILFNAYTPQTLSFIDLGPDQAINTTTRDGATVLLDTVIAADIAFEGAPVTGTYREGTYSLALINSDLEIIHRLDNYTITADTEKTLLLMPDGEQPVPADADPDSGGIQFPAGFTFRSTVLPGLVFDTEPSFGSPLGIGRILFTVYLLPVNLVGLLLLVALVGVIVISRPSGEKQERRANMRRRVSRPLVNVIAQQTGGEVTTETPKLGSGDGS